MQVGKVKHHARLQDNRFFAGRQLDVSIDDSDSGVDRWIQSIDLHKHRIEVRHLRIDICKIGGVNRVDFGHKFRQAPGMSVKLNKRPSNIGSNAVMTT